MRDYNLTKLIEKVQNAKREPRADTIEILNLSTLGEIHKALCDLKRRISYEHTFTIKLKIKSKLADQSELSGDELVEALGNELANLSEAESFEAFQYVETTEVNE